jgi:hypothetical protein
LENDLEFVGEKLGMCAKFKSGKHNEKIYQFEFLKLYFDIFSPLKGRNFSSAGLYLNAINKYLNKRFFSQLFDFFPHYFCKKKLIIM